MFNDYDHVTEWKDNASEATYSRLTRFANSCQVHSLTSNERNPSPQLSRSKSNSVTRGGVTQIRRSLTVPSRTEVYSNFSTSASRNVSTSCSMKHDSIVNFEFLKPWSHMTASLFTEFQINIVSLDWLSNKKVSWDERNTNRFIDEIKIWQWFLDGGVNMRVWNRVMMMLMKFLLIVDCDCVQFKKSLRLYGWLTWSSFIRTA